MTNDNAMYSDMIQWQWPRNILLKCIILFLLLEIFYSTIQCNIIINDLLSTIMQYY